jgi:uncharacterized membrane protein
MLQAIDHFLFLAQHGGSWSHWPFGPGFLGGWLLTLSKFVFIGLVLAVIIWVLRWAFGPGGWLRDEGLDRPEAESEDRSSALHILDERLARGEITPEEYRERKQALKEESHL